MEGSKSISMKYFSCSVTIELQVLVISVTFWLPLDTRLPPEKPYIRR